MKKIFNFLRNLFKIQDIDCPVCGYYCLGKGGAGCIDKLSAYQATHRHKWQDYVLIGNKDRTVFYCRKCECGLDQIQKAGPMGDGQWDDRSKPLTHEWEQEWVDNAVPYYPDH